MGLGSEIRKKPTPDPGGWVKKAPDPGSGRLYFCVNKVGPSPDPQTDAAPIGSGFTKNLRYQLTIFGKVLDDADSSVELPFCVLHGLDHLSTYLQKVNV
jgi:hypothetical protein